MRAWSLTDQGRVRMQNQDACSYLQFELGDGTEILAAVVCDGMGGAKAGNIASEIAVETFMEELRKDFYAPSVTDVQMLCAVKTANRLIYEKAQSDPDYEGMGTTLVAAVTDGSHVTVANVGDSRCYLIRDGGIQQLTKDHSVVEDMVDRGEIERADAWKHPRRNYITRALGAEEQVECDLFFRELEPGDVLLLCSDGLSNMVPDLDILKELSAPKSVSDTADRLVEMANEAGGKDNISVVVIDFTGEEELNA